MDKQIRIDRCRELLNELGRLGIQPAHMTAARAELKESIASFTHGPLFDEKEDPLIEKTLVDNIDQLRPKDRADEERRRYEFDR